MQIGSYLNTYNNMINSGSEINTKSPEGVKTVSNTVENLSSGSVFEGSVVSIKGDQVTLGLSNGGNISARLDGSVNLSEGQSVFFEVKSNDGATIAIRPVSMETGNNPILMNALNTAGVQVTERSLNMVNSMMKESMPIDSNSLLAMNRQLLSNPDISPDTVVLMNKLQIPVSKENASMLKAYQTNQAQISNDINNIVDSIDKLISSKGLSAEQSIELNKNLVSLFTDSSLVSENNTDSVSEFSSVDNSGNIASDEAVAVAENIAQQDSATVSTDSSVDNVNNLRTENLEIKNSEIENSVINSNEQSVVTVAEEAVDIPSNTLVSQMPKQQITSLAESLKSIGFDLKDSGVLDDKGNISKDLTAKEMLVKINDFINGKSLELPEPDVKKLFSNEGYKSLFSNVIKDNWSLKPDDITKPEAVKKLYEKILNDAAKISQFADVNAKDSAIVQKSVNDLKNNVSFMNQMNEVYAFVQIPIKMTNQQTNSELYVYQNKKKKVEESDELSAFLHFDLDSLGSTDISVKLKQKNVSCDWFLEDEASLKLIEDNIDLLEKRLQAKGYNCSMKVEGGNQKIDFVNDFLKAGEPKTTEVHRYSFDVRT